MFSGITQIILIADPSQQPGGFGFEFRRGRRSTARQFGKCASTSKGFWTSVQERSIMGHKSTLTYAELDNRLRALGFSVHTQKEKARIYTHEDSGARVILPDTPLRGEVLPHHLAVVRHTLKMHNLENLDAKESNSSKTINQYPSGSESLDILIADVIREYRREHPDEWEELEESPPQWYAPLENGGSPQDGMLTIGKSIFVIRNNKVEKEIRKADAPPASWI
jgi:predicted RNA binding protein YcfA (HicA-like mRNA interferase family)